MLLTIDPKMAEHDSRHIPVMTTEVLDCLDLESGKTYLDCTIGLGGHACLAADILGPQGRLIGLDRDQQALDIAGQRLSACRVSYNLAHKDFRYADAVLDDLGIESVDAILMDLGVSSLQLDQADRGFSLKADGPLDMRMDQENFICAYDLVNSLSEKELAFILKKYGEERWHYRIARFIAEARSRHPIETTQELKDIVWRAVPRHNRYQKIHPATRTFQAIRIAVNRELESLEVALQKSLELLAAKGRLCVISFHSLEDRIVKNIFRTWAKEGRVELLTKKPLRPTEQEIQENPRSRSARLRAVQKI